MTSERFAQLIVSDDVVRRIKNYRAKLPRLEELRREISDTQVLIAANPDPKASMNKELAARLSDLKRQAQAITTLKTGLPVLLYQCSCFDETTSKKGYRGRWRKQQAARLNGLFMLDVDHVDNPQALFNGWLEEWGKKRYDSLSDVDKMRLAGIEISTADYKSGWAQELGIVLVHITPSGHGLRFVAKADTAVGNLADNQRKLAKLLGVEPDEACKDASRCSFCPGFEDILYLNKEELFTYENKTFDEKFGNLYRGGDSRPTADSGHHSSRSVHVDAAADSTAGDNGAQPAAGGTAKVTDRNAEAEPDAADGVNEKTDSYHGRKYSDIADKWFASVLGSMPSAGERHHSLYRLACDLRYITDFNPDLLARALAECEVGRQIAAERGADELHRIASDACALAKYRSTPKRLRTVLQSLGIQQFKQDGDDAPAEKTIDYDYWWHRLEPLLEKSPVLRESVMQLPEHHRLGGVLAAGAMLGTYLTRCWWEHFDGKPYRLSFLAYIIGSAASGKSFVTELDHLIMEPMLAADRVGREWERQYKEDMKKRAASSKNAKQDAPEQQHPVIRYVPSTISNAMLYRRLTDNIDNESIGPDGQPMHLHCYTMEPELATALRAQTGSWAGKNDLELKSFHNEYAGVDYANDQSVNGIIQVNWNQVVTGTQEAMGRKIRPSMVLDGLVTRLALFPMPSNDFQMIERRKAIRQQEREDLLRTIGLQLDQVKGELSCTRLVDFCYEYEKELCREAAIEQDECLDYFRKRIPVLMMRYTLVRMVCRDPLSAIAGKPIKVTDDDLEFARLIGDWCLMAQMYMYGEMVMEALQREREAFVPRRRSTKVREYYAMLPEMFTAENLVSIGACKNVNSAGSTIRRWLGDQLVEKTDKPKVYQKKYNQIP